MRAFGKISLPIAPIASSRFWQQLPDDDHYTDDDEYSREKDSNGAFLDRIDDIGAIFRRDQNRQHRKRNPQPSELEPCSVNFISHPIYC